MGSCCTPDNSCSTTTEATAVAVADSTVTVYAVSGMTCDHCKTAITKSVSALDGVISVDVDVDGGLVTVTTGGEPDDAAITAAVDDAGYELTGRA
ncbi:heavy-metal-associated domain-containing protein [Streptomyces sp. NBC_00233]|uniref:heavy-metal-associated domain-containing protein n=1 Tax=Streptomyces sp. NBC_00233 TaxID=2975686 RepID=UPI002254AAFF|nr:heavy-metal-associated domain-containing protein [Streptomyces sp. NBC_00233]MCX5227819.1 heavy-metal-associated domain-containing protein [Streptomyces sp. NBC_00233]